jgi:hypothetical protein
MANLHSLRTLAQEHIRIGDLPTRRASRTYAGKGTGSKCALCDSLIAPSEVEYEMEFERPDTPVYTTVRMHLHCSQVWDQECRID